MNKKRMRNVLLPIHLVFVAAWLLISLYLLVMTLTKQQTETVQDLFFTLLLPSGIGSMMTGMMMGFMLFHCPHNILWLRIKMILSMVLMLVISLWLRDAAYGGDTAHTIYALSSVVLLLLLAVAVSYTKPKGKKKSSTEGNRIHG